MHSRIAPPSPLHLLATRWDGCEGRIYLTRDEGALGAWDVLSEAEAVAYVRVVSDSAPGYYTAAVELLDLDGDADGVAAWVESHADELVGLHGQAVLS